MQVISLLAGQWSLDSTSSHRSPVTDLESRAEWNNFAQML